MRGSELFQDAIANWEDAVTSKRDGSGMATKVVTPADVFEATDSLKRKLQELADYGKGNHSISDLPLINASKKMANYLKGSLEDTGSWGEMGDFQRRLNSAYSSMQTPLSDFASAAMSKKEGALAVDPAKISSIFRSVEKEKPLAGFKSDKVAGFFEPARNLLRTVGDLHAEYGVSNSLPPVPTDVLDEMLNGNLSDGAKFANHFFSSAPGAVGWAASHAVGTAAGAAVGHPYLGYRGGEHLYPFLKRLSLKPVQGSAAAVLRMLAAGEHDGVPQVSNYAQKIVNGSKRIENSVGNLFKAGSKQALESEFSDATREAIKKQVDNGTLQDQMRQEEQAGGKQQITQNPSFAEGGEVKAPVAPSPNVTAERPLFDGMKHVATVFPNQAPILGAVRPRVLNYLNQAKPQDAPRKAFDAPMPNKPGEKSYNKALDIAQKPLSVLDRIKDGTITPEHVKHLNAMYPELYSHLQKKITEKITEAQMNGEKPNHRVRQGLSLFMGAELDSNLTPQNMMAAQATFQKPVPQQQGASPRPKGGTSKLGDMAGQYRTPDQAASMRQARPKP